MGIKAFMWSFTEDFTVGKVQEEEFCTEKQTVVKDQVTGFICKTRMLGWMIAKDPSHKGNAFFSALPLHVHVHN